MQLQSIKKANVKGKTVLVRTDFDVPLKQTVDSNQVEVRDDFRIRRCLHTIEYLIAKKAKVVLLSKLGRPKGIDLAFSMAPVASRVAELLGLEFVRAGGSKEKTSDKKSSLYFLEGSPVTAKAGECIKSLKPGEVACLDNLFFEPGEKEGDESFAKVLACYGDIYVNDSFATAHRTYASVVALPALLPHFAGLNLEREVSTLGKLIVRPKRPYTIMIGGIKLGEKLEGLRGLIERADSVLVGGGLSTLFFSAQGYQTGTSILDGGNVPQAKEIWRNYKDKIILPRDVVVARIPESTDGAHVVEPHAISPGEMILDIGPGTIRSYSDVIKQAKTLVWSGPMGLFEKSAFAHGTKALGRLFASRCGSYAFGVAGGGNTLDAIDQLKMGQYIDFLSTGGSAMLQYLAGEPMPGIDALAK